MTPLSIKDGRNDGVKRHYRHVSPWTRVSDGKEPSHLAALGDDDVLEGSLVRVDARVFYFPDDVHAIYNLAEDDVLAVQPYRGRSGDEELAAVGVGAGVLGWRERCAKSARERSTNGHG